MNKKWSSFPTLTSERLFLREISFNDANAIFELRTNPQINKYVDRKTPKTITDAVDFIKMIQDLVKNEEGIFWVITLKNTSEVIGSIGIRHFNDDFSYAEIGYELHPDFHKKGIMSEALQTIINFSFNTFGLKTIEAFTHKNNIGSIALLEKHQFIYQPKRREEGFINNRIFKLKNKL